MALFILRPWEKLLPILGDLHFERVYAVFMIVIIMISKIKYRLTLQTVSIFMFVGAILLSSYSAWESSLAWAPLYKYLTLVIFYLILIFTIKSLNELVFMVICYVITMFLYLAKAQWEYFFYDAHVYRMGVTRLIGIENTLGGPNWLGFSIVLSLPFVVFLWMSRHEIASGWNYLWRKRFKRALQAYTALAIVSIIMTNSRSSMLGLIVFLLLSTFIWSKAKQRMIYIFVTISMLMSIWVLIPDENKNRFRSIWSIDAGPMSAHISAQGRIEGFKAGIEMFKSHTLTGVGLGNFIPYRMKYVDGTELQPHNLVGQVLGETGLLGILTFLFMVGIILINIRKARYKLKMYHNSSSDIISNLALACRNTIILLFFEGLFEHNLLRFNWLWLAAFMVIAIQCSVEIIKNQNNKNVKYATNGV